MGDSTVIPSRPTAFGVELIFGGFALIPPERNARLVEASIIWDYGTWLNLVFLVRGFFVWRFLKTGGLAMLRMMNRPASPGHAHSCSLEDDQTEVDPERATAGAMRCIPTGFDFGSDRGEPHCCKKRFPPPHRSVVSGHSRPVGGASLPNY
jgi:hypothetical protein